MAQQTALQFLIEQLKGYEYDDNDFIFTGIISSELIEQAKQMEKEQHNETWLTAQEESLHENYLGRSRLFLEYFKETYERK